MLLVVDCSHALGALLLAHVLNAGSGECLVAALLALQVSTENSSQEAMTVDQARCCYERSCATLQAALEEP